MIKSEQKFHAKLMKWLQYNMDKFPKSFLIETKVVRREQTRFPYRELSMKEERLLLKAKHGTLIQTHSDLGGMGTNCDGSVISGGGFIFLQWTRRCNKEFHIIDIDDFTEFRNQDKSKSLTEDFAREIALFSAEHI